jgi:flavin-dependent thymidylate synthase
MYTAEPVEKKGPRVWLINATVDPLGTLASACSMYEGKKVLRSQVTDEMRHYYWEDIKKTKLKAPLEFLQVHFLIEGVTRAFTHQMVRQRTACFVQESMRFAVKDNMAEEVGLPPSIREGSHEAAIWRGAMEGVGEAYNTLIAMGVPAEDARGLAPTDVRTRLHYRSDFRNFTDQVGNRLCTQAQFEWRLVITRMVEAMREHQSPCSDHERSDSWQWQLISQDDYFRPPCYMAGHCTFRGDMDRYCKIRDRVEEGKFDEIDPMEWLADPSAARKAPVPPPRDPGIATR